MLARSKDGGVTFPDEWEVDANQPVGRPDVDFLADGSIVVIWVGTSGDNATLQARLYGPDEKVQPPVEIATVSKLRALGFPRIATKGDGGIVTWTAKGKQPGIRVMSISVH